MLRRILVLLVAAASTGPLAGAAELAVVVSTQNPVDELSVSDLREVLLMERQHWRGGRRIYLILPGSGTLEKDLLLRRALRMSEDALRRHYLGKLYGGEIPAFPGTVASGSAARTVVAHAPNALAIIDSSEVDSTVKVLRIGGRRPGDEGYLLAGPR
jgi:hypothetical protein